MRNGVISAAPPMLVSPTSTPMKKLMSQRPAWLASPAIRSAGSMSAFAPRSGGRLPENAEQRVHSLLVYRDFAAKFPLREIVERHSRGEVILAEAVPDPAQIFTQLGGPELRESDPTEIVVDGQNSARPAQVDAAFVHGIQIDR